MKKHGNFLFNIWKPILELPFGRRLVFFGSLFSLLFLFFPWFSSSLVREGEGFQNYNAFGIFPIFGVMIFIITLFSLLLVLREIFSHQGFLGSYIHGKILVFLLGIGVYTIIIATFVFYGFADQIPSLYGEVNFGIALTFVAMGIAFAGALFSQNYVPKGAERRIFANPDEVDLSGVNLSPEEKSQLSLDHHE